MFFHTVSDFSRGSLSALYVSGPAHADELLRHTDDEDLVILSRTDFFTPPEKQMLSSAFGSRLLVPFHERETFPQASVLVTSAVSGGEVLRWFADALDSCSGQCWLWERPICMAFPLPCPLGQGAPLSDFPEEEGFYSAALCCRYLHAPGRLVLFDTPQTMEEKRILAKKLGFMGAVPPINK